MWFKELILKNAGCFKNFAIELKHGSIGIFGKNGSGKSTLTNMMYGILCNDFGRFDGVKIDCICNTTQSNEMSFIQGIIEHDGHELNIVRYLKPRGTITSSLSIDNNEEIINSNKVQEVIDETLGIDRKLLDLYCFKTQDKIYDFLSTTPGERAKAFAILCKTEECEELWNMLGVFLNKDIEVNRVLTDNSDEILMAISSYKEKISELESGITTESEKLLNLKSLESAKEILRKQDRLEDLFEQREKENARVVSSTGSLGIAEENVRIRKQKGEKLKAKLEEDKPKAEDAMLALKSLEQYKKYKVRKNQLKNEKEELIIEEKRNLVPKVPHRIKTGGTQDANKLRKEHVEKVNDLDEARLIIASLTSSNITNCPTCGTPVSNLYSYIEAKKKIIEDYPGEIELLEEMIEEIETYNSSIRKYEKWRAGYDARLKANKENLDSLKDIKVPEGNEDELKEIVKNFTILEEELDECRAVYRKRVQALDAVKANLEASTRRLGEINNEIIINTESEEKVNRARTRLDEHVTASQNIARLEGELIGLKKQISDKEDELKSLRTKLKRSKKVRKMAYFVHQAREVLHRDNLPKRVAQANLSQMEGSINEGLGLFGDPFWVESDDNLSFIAHKPGEPAQGAGRLSTGQKVVLALSFWPCVASLWQSDLGMLVLDEPTANLDIDNRTFLAQALSTLTVSVRSKRQLIMVTHDQSLASSFDQVINLDEYKP